MSGLQIHHRTVYRYSAPVRFGLHRLVLRPREGHRITVRRHQLTVSPGAILTWMTDIFGNHIALADFQESADELVVDNQVELDLLDLPADPGAVPPAHCSAVTLPAAWLQYEQAVAAAYAVPAWPEELRAVSDWMQSIVRPEGMSATGAMQALTAAIHGTIRYRRREEPGVQKPSVTLQLGTGSCRDMATLALEAARSLGLAARFVSGYMHSTASEAGLGSTHAWVEVYLPDCGWSAFDPTTGGAAGRHHIALGVSTHPRGVMPISGSFDGRAGSSLGLQVSLTILPQPGAPPPGIQVPAPAVPMPVPS